MHLKHWARVVVLGIGIASCGGGGDAGGTGPGASGLEKSTTWSSLTTAEKGTLCDWVAAKFGGYGMTIDCGNGMTAVFADEMHYLGAVKQSAFPVRGVVRASGKCPSKKRQHFHNNPVGAPSIFGAPTYIATPLPYRNAISCGF